MPVFEGEVIVSFPYVITAADVEDAEYDVLASAKEDFPEAAGFAVNNITKVD